MCRGQHLWNRRSPAGMQPRDSVSPPRGALELQWPSELSYSNLRGHAFLPAMEQSPNVGNPGRGVAAQATLTGLMARFCSLIASGHLGLARASSGRIQVSGHRVHRKCQGGTTRSPMQPCAVFTLSDLRRQPKCPDNLYYQDSSAPSFQTAPRTLSQPQHTSGKAPSQVRGG